MQTPAQLANLRPPWKKGDCPNPGGRPKGVVYPAEYLRSMLGMTQEDLQEIRDDETEPVSKRAAARMALAMVDDVSTARERREAFSQVADRTSGKPGVQEPVVDSQNFVQKVIILPDSEYQKRLPGASDEDKEDGEGVEDGGEG